jgi:hypothetical protein
MRQHGRSHGLDINRAPHTFENSTSAPKIVRVYVIRDLNQLFNFFCIISRHLLYRTDRPYMCLHRMPFNCKMHELMEVFAQKDRIVIKIDFLVASEPVKAECI